MADTINTNSFFNQPEEGGGISSVQVLAQNAFDIATNVRAQFRDFVGSFDKYKLDADENDRLINNTVSNLDIQTDETDKKLEDIIEEFKENFKSLEDDIRGQDKRIDDLDSKVDQVSEVFFKFEQSQKAAAEKAADDAFIAQDAAQKAGDKEDGGVAAGGLGGLASMFGVGDKGSGGGEKPEKKPKGNFWTNPWMWGMMGAGALHGMGAGINRGIGGAADFLTGGLFDFDGRSGGGGLRKMFGGKKKDKEKGVEAEVDSLESRVNALESGDPPPEDDGKEWIKDSDLSDKDRERVQEIRDEMERLENEGKMGSEEWNKLWDEDTAIYSKYEGKGKIESKKGTDEKGLEPKGEEGEKKEKGLFGGFFDGLFGKKKEEKPVSTSERTVTRRKVKPHHFDMKTGKAYIDGEEVPIELYQEFQSMSSEEKLRDPRFSTGDPISPESGIDDSGLKPTIEKKEKGLFGGFFGGLFGKKKDDQTSEENVKKTSKLSKEFNFGKNTYDLSKPLGGLSRKEFEALEDRERRMLLRRLRAYANQNPEERHDDIKNNETSPIESKEVTDEKGLFGNFFGKKKEEEKSPFEERGLGYEFGQINPETLTTSFKKLEKGSTTTTKDGETKIEKTKKWTRHTSDIDTRDILENKEQILSQLPKGTTIEQVINGEVKGVSAEKLSSILKNSDAQKSTSARKKKAQETFEARQPGLDGKLITGKSLSDDGKIGQLSVKGERGYRRAVLKGEKGPEGIMRHIAGAGDWLTSGRTDFDRRGQWSGDSSMKQDDTPFGLMRGITGLADKLTGDRTDFDKRGAGLLQFDAISGGKSTSSKTDIGQTSGKKQSITEKYLTDKGMDLTKLQGGLSNEEYNALTHRDRNLLNRHLKVSDMRGELNKIGSVPSQSGANFNQFSKPPEDDTPEVLPIQIAAGDNTSSNILNQMATDKGDFSTDNDTADGTACTISCINMMKANSTRQILV